MSEEEPSLIEEMMEINPYWFKRCNDCKHGWIGEPLTKCPKCGGFWIGVEHHPVEGRLSVTDTEEVI